MFVTKGGGGHIKKKYIYIYIIYIYTYRFFFKDQYLGYPVISSDSEFKANNLISVLSFDFVLEINSINL